MMVEVGRALLIGSADFPSLDPAENPARGTADKDLGRLLLLAGSWESDDL